MSHKPSRIIRKMMCSQLFIQKLISNITNKNEKYLDKQGKILLQ